jgi:hypothetical protein
MGVILSRSTTTELEDPTMRIAPTENEGPAARHVGDCCREARRPMGVAAAGALLALLVPKCPMCLAAYLSFLGVAATGLVWLRPLGVVLMLAGVTVAAWRTLARRSEGRSGTPAS